MSDLSNTFLEMIRQAATAQAGIPTRTIRYCRGCHKFTDHLVVETRREDGTVDEDYTCDECGYKFYSVVG